MAIPTSRTNEVAEIIIDKELCNGCGLCVTVCKDFSLIIENNKVIKSNEPLFGCLACGHCMAICPTGAITINGRTLTPNDLFDIPAKDSIGSYEQILALFQHRRSIREFKDKNVEPEILEKILTAAKTCPMGLPPSDVNVLVLNGKEKTRAFAKDFSGYLKSLRFMTNKFFLALMRPFWGKENDELFRNFIDPLFYAYIDEMDKGNNHILYDAPLAMYFYGSPYSDPADPVIAATYAMIAAESLGLGTCMIGGIHPFIQSGKRAKKFRETHGIKFKSKEGLFLIIGYPAVKYQKGINRSFASIEMIN
ncbi:MAG: nitroreductase family protein [Melioribacteraceae bacterium]|nr:nitroreductase family protein [Melioribacteraceae bacterium]